MPRSQSGQMRRPITVTTGSPGFRLLQDSQVYDMRGVCTPSLGVDRRSGCSSRVRWRLSVVVATVRP